MRLGVLPFLLLIAIIVFSLLSSRFYGPENIKNVMRQSSYLTMVAMGQMLALLTGGIRSVGGNDPRGHVGVRRCGHGGHVCGLP